MSVLILGSTQDAHLSRMRKFLVDKSIDVDFIDIYQGFSSVSYQFDRFSQDVIINNKSILNYQSIYWRYPVAELLPSDQYSIRQLAEQQEIWNFMMPIDLVSDISCINPFLASIKMENNIFQLSHAQNCELPIPQTVITSDQETVAKFAKYVGPCIEKSLGMRWDDDNRPVYAARWSEDSVNTGILPKIYQQHINREHEVRVYMIGGEVISVGIELEDSFESPIDWKLSASRREPLYCHTSISEELLCKLKRFHNEGGMIYAAYDIIIDSVGKEFFLECNPSGNWDFLPKEFSENIIEALSLVLTEGT